MEPKTQNMEYQLYGGKLKYWIVPCCLMYKSVANDNKETSHTISFEILHWYIALSITKRNY